MASLCWRQAREPISTTCTTLSPIDEALFDIPGVCSRRNSPITSCSGDIGTISLTGGACNGVEGGGDKGNIQIYIDRYEYRYMEMGILVDLSGQFDSRFGSVGLYIWDILSHLWGVGFTQFSI